MFLTAAKSNGREGRVICVRTKDGGKSWEFVSYVGPEPEGNGYAIMPSSLRLSPSTILTTIRQRNFIEAFRSEDDGKTWTFVGKPVPDTGRGNPPMLVKLADGRLVITYGYRAEPAGIRARFSSDNGKTWGDEFILRDDGGSWDLGYTRTVQRPDGNLVTVYYYNLDNDKERFIGATVWNLGSK
jgi:Neuraminidase (sialidase)